MALKTLQVKIRHKTLIYTCSMKKTRFTESQITQALKEHEAGKNVLDICRELQINHNPLYNEKKKYAGMDAGLLRKFKEL